MLRSRKGRTVSLLLVDIWCVINSLGSYENVDFAITRALQYWVLLVSSSLLYFFSGYDINCVHGINWNLRLSFIDRYNKINWPIILRCVPKFHLPAHKGSCRWRNSYMYMWGVGNTDGEACERRWAILNAIGRSIREMCSGHRIDTINHHYSDFNWQKLIRLRE